MIKEYCSNSGFAVIRNNHYGSALEVFDELFEEAKKDFPTLQRSDVRVVQYGGNRYKRTFGIEFSVDSAPSDYEPIRDMEYTL